MGFIIPLTGHITERSGAQSLFACSSVCEASASPYMQLFSNFLLRKYFFLDITDRRPANSVVNPFNIDWKAHQIPHVGTQQYIKRVLLNSGFNCDCWSWIFPFCTFCDPFKPLSISIVNLHSIFIIGRTNWKRKSKEDVLFPGHSASAAISVPQCPAPSWSRDTAVVWNEAK